MSNIDDKKSAILGIILFLFMSLKKYLLLLLCLLFFNSIYSIAQESTPHLSGKVIIKMKDGLISADLKLSNLPELDTAYKILLNRGMNMKFIRDSSVALRYNNTLADDFFKYRLHNGKNYISIPKTLKLTYSGAFPIYTDTLNSYDYKGLIALNGKTLRASEQSKWFPVLYDVRNDREITAVTYDITVECEDCKTIYINGSAAVPGPIARLRADKPFEPLLFTGNYDAQKFPGSDFLNAQMPEATAEAFDKEINGIRSFYEKTLKVPYGERITFLQHTAVEVYGPDRSWGFVTFPTIAVAGGKFKNEIDISTKKFNHIYKYYFYSHELGHYYFGRLLTPNSTLRYFFLESIAEYLSVKAVEHEYGRDSTASYIKRAKVRLGGKTIIPLAKVTNPDQVTELYRYSYGPMILLALEKRTGEKKMYGLLQAALKHRREKTDYEFLSKIASEAGIKASEWKSFEQQVLSITDCTSIFDYL